MNALDEKGIDKVAIYALKCPESGAVRYIGKANNPKNRLATHIRGARKRRTPVHCWIGSLASPPVMEVLEWVDAADWVAAERRLIAEYRMHARLLNLADGGDEPGCSREVRVANGLKVLALIKADPIRLGLRNFCGHLGRQARRWRNEGEPEMAARTQDLLDKVRSMAETNPELAFYRLHQVPQLRARMCLPKELTSG